MTNPYYVELLVLDRNIYVELLVLDRNIWNHLTVQTNV